MNSLPKRTESSYSDYYTKNPVFIYHHLMKCGGTSVTRALQNWFQIEFDSLEMSPGINTFIKKRYNLNAMNSDTCITGHFQYDGINLFQRYPEICTSKNLKAFTIVREPINLLTSLYYYVKSRGGYQGDSLEDALLHPDNFLAKLFPCTEENYKEILDRYFFIGITERMQESFNKLAVILNKRKIRIPFINISEKDSQISLLKENVVKEFKEKNKLDYMIYEYCLEKFNMI
ncbi:MAG: hypothetical protein ABI840_07525 [bacterium]